MNIQISEITSRGDLRDFINYPFSLYRDNPYWVPSLFEDDLNTLDPRRNPAFDHSKASYWMAYQNGHAVGRIAGIINDLHAQKWNQPYARFGWIDFVDDPAVSGALLNTLETWARNNGMSAVHGPLGFTDMDHEGMLVEGFDRLGTMATIYNHPYYPRHLELHGYAKDIDWVEYEINVPGQSPEKVAQLAETVLRRYDLHLLPARTRKDLLPYAHQLFDVLNEAYGHLYGVVPLTERQVDVYVKQYFDFIRPEMAPMVLDSNDRVIAFGIAMPSLSKALQRSQGRLFPFGFVHLLSALNFWNGYERRADLYLVAIRHEYQGKGINAVLMNQMIIAFNKLGIRCVESNPELENNDAVQAQWKHFERRQHKRRRCYIKHLTA